jgi:hypothetical protein
MGPVPPTPVDSLPPPAPVVIGIVPASVANASNSGERPHPRKPANRKPRLTTDSL